LTLRPRCVLSALFGAIDGLGGVLSYDYRAA
jgi:hypothetical protein